MKEFENISAKDVVKRMQEAINASNDAGLASFLETKSSTISTWKNRNKIPFDAVIVTHLRTGVDVKWLLFGEESQTRATNSKVGFVEEFKKTIVTGIQMELLRETEKTSDDNINILGVHLFNTIFSVEKEKSSIDKLKA